MQITERMLCTTMLSDLPSASAECVSVMMNLDAPLIACLIAEREMVESSCWTAPSRVRPAASRSEPSSSVRNTKPRSTLVNCSVICTSDTRMSSMAPNSFSVRAASRNHLSRSNSLPCPDVFESGHAAPFVSSPSRPNRSIGPCNDPSCTWSPARNRLRSTFSPLTKVPHRLA